MFIGPRKDKVVTFKPALDTSAYAAADVIGAAPIHLSQLVSSNGGTAEITKIIVNDKDKQGAAIDLVFYSAAPANQTDNAAYNPSAADSDNIIGTISIVTGDYVTFANQKVATHVCSPSFAFKTVNSSDLWVVLVSRGTPTYTVATQMTIKIEVKQE